MKKLLPNGDTESVTFDYLNRDVSQIATTGTNSLYQFTYAYDLAGNDTTVTETYPGGLNNRTVANTYDNINRLGTEAITTGTATVSTVYTYDKANNRSTKVITGGTSAGTTSYTYNNINQLTAYSDGTTSSTLTYDFNGNRAKRVCGSGTDTYSYDVENRLVGLAKGIGGSGITTGTYAYLYDYRTRRVKRDESNASGVATQVVFSGGTSEQEYTLSGTAPVLTVEYVRGSDYGGGVGGVLYTLRGALLSYTHENRRGDVVAKTDATGSLTYQAAYEAFGKRTQEQGGTLDRQKANTKDEDPTGLLDEGFRYRDLDTGSFITKDPAGFVDGPNLYTYVKQNPWTSFDPEGLSSDAIAAAAPVVVVAAPAVAGAAGPVVAGVVEFIPPVGISLGVALLISEGMDYHYKHKSYPHTAFTPPLDPSAPVALPNGTTIGTPQAGSYTGNPQTIPAPGSAATDSNAGSPGGVSAKTQSDANADATGTQSANKTPAKPADAAAAAAAPASDVNESSNTGPIVDNGKGKGGKRAQATNDAAAAAAGGPPPPDDDEHTRNARKSSKGRHEKGRARKNRDKPGGEKGDQNRDAPRDRRGNIIQGS